MEYAKQAVLHLRTDKVSDKNARMQTTTVFVSGTIKLVSALWSQDLSAVVSATKSLASAAKEFRARQPKKWYGITHTSLLSVHARDFQLTRTDSRFGTGAAP